MQHIQSRSLSAFLGCVLGLFGLTGNLEAHPGFLVLAEDRGFVGNREIEQSVSELQAMYPSTLAWLGRESSGFQEAYSAYVQDGIQHLKEEGATEIIVIPFFLSDSDPVLQQAKDLVPKYAQDLPIKWAPKMVYSHLIGQVLLDRVEEVSTDPSQERLILLGTGAMDEQSELGIQTDLKTLGEYIQRYHQFAALDVEVYYDPTAESGETKNKELEARIVGNLAKKGDTIVVPAFIEVKYDYSMARASWLGRTFHNLKATYQTKELLPHPNIALWLKQIANAYSTINPNEIGLILMPHGATQPWNDAVERMLKPLQEQYLTEMAYGMGDTQVIQSAVSRLEKRGVKRMLFFRLYPLEEQFKDKIEYILGISEKALTQNPPMWSIPSQIRSAALFSSLGGYEENFVAAQILHERIMEISHNPEKETVLLLAHGSRSESTNTHRLSAMKKNIDWLKQEPHCSRLLDIHAATVREDWPDLREQSLKKIRTYIQSAAQSSRVLVIANRLYGPGPYEEFLEGLEYELNGKGLLHWTLTQWIEQRIQEASTSLMSPVPGLLQVGKSQES